jgi:hypothetical protein
MRTRQSLFILITPCATGRAMKRKFRESEQSRYSHFVIRKPAVGLLVCVEEKFAPQFEAMTASKGHIVKPIGRMTNKKEWTVLVN